MPPATESQKLTLLRQSLHDAKTEFEQKFPALVPWLTEATADAALDSVDASILHDFQTHDHSTTQLKASISQEEFAAIVQKMAELTQFPPGKLEHQTQLYLEQQLSDLIGADVTASLDDHELPFVNGIMAALPHFKRFPTDTLTTHETILEAGMQEKRGAFDWFVDGTTVSALATDREKYFIAVPLSYDSQDQKDYPAYKKWYMYRKVIVINPAEYRAVVACVGTIAPLNLLKHQYGGSPEVIRQGMVWSPAAQGKILLFFIDDPENKINLGPIDFSHLVKPTA